MGVTTTINSVTAEDPYRSAISAVTGRDQATVVFTPLGTFVVGGLTRQDVTDAYRIEMGGGTAPGTGVLLDMGGFPCSDSLAEAKCSDSDAHTLCTDGLNVPYGTSITATVAYANTGSPADQVETMYVYAGSGFHNPLQ